MARIFVMSDNLAAKVEVFDDPLTGKYAALCAGCNRGLSATDSTDLLDGERGADHFEDAIEETAYPHADRCQNCADDACMIPTRHVRGHRCRKI